jgi:hypothetical protein
MSAIGDLVQLLLSTGLSADSIKAAVDLAQQHAQESADKSADKSADIRRHPVDSAAERRRTYDRERQRKIRRQSADKLSEPNDVLSSPEGLQEEAASKNGVNGRARGARGTRMAPGAALIAEWREFARSEGAADAEIDRTWSEFVDYWVGVPGQRGVKLDWFATWRNRVRAVVQRGKPVGARGDPHDWRKAVL